MQFLYSLRSKGVLDKRVLSAMEQIDRAEFIKGPFEGRAYDDVPLPISCAQTISQPSIVGLMTQALDVQPRNKVLEIGTGSGYQCAILCELGMKVYSIERQKELHTLTVPLLAEMGYDPTLYYGDGYKGKEVFAPYKGIIVTCGAPEAPNALLSQLEIGGRLVIPVSDSGEEKSQRMFTYNRISETEFTKQDHGAAAFVPMLVSKSRG